MGRITSYNENGRLMSDFDKSAYGPCWYYRGQSQTTEFAAPNEGVKLAANLKRLEEDNAKLRELVKRVISRYNDQNREYWVNQEPLPCDLCGMELQCIEAPKHDRCLFYEYLRELGVGVDDGTEQVVTQ